MHCSCSMNSARGISPKKEKKTKKKKKAKRRNAKAKSWSKFVSYVEATLLLLMCISNSYHVVFFKFVYICLYPITCITNYMIHDKKTHNSFTKHHLAKNKIGNPEKIYDHIGNPIISAIKIFTHLKPIRKPFSKPKPVLLFNVINWDAWLES